MSYCTRADIEMIFGRTNVQVWADMEGDENEDEITARIARAIAVTTVALHDRIRQSRYVLPLEALSDSEETDALATIVDLAARMAGLWLHDNRGIIERDENGNILDNLAHQRRIVASTIQSILLGEILLDCETDDDINDIPKVC
jgi:phage gp36-like protein